MSDDTILQELRDRFEYGTNEWADIRKEGATDMRFITGDPWEPEDRKAREEAGRPVLSLDELSQYVNQLINDVRQAKRGIKVTPQGNGANDETAAFRQGLHRQIEYRSNATMAAYMTLAENAFQRSYGFLRIKAKYLHERSFNQELLLDPLPNPDLVTIDPDIIRTDGADMQWGFIHESRSEKQFAREFPDAEIKSFTTDHERLAPGWIRGKRVQIAEYWTIEYRRRQLLQLKPPPPSADDPRPEPLEAFVDELELMPSSDQILQSRAVDDPSVRQYFTNGLELLVKKGQPQKYTPWPGKSIPIVPCFGKVLWVPDAAGATKRVILSLIRLARDPQMLYCYYRTCQAELVGMTPKFPYFVYKGQLDETQKANLAKSLHEPIAFIEVEAVVPGVAHDEVLPPPSRQPYDPPIQSLEMGAEAARRAIQAAIGTMPLPTAAQRQNEKSGKALERMESSAQKGSFHFVDHYDEALTRTGQLLDELYPHYYDTIRDVTIRKPDDTPAVVRINDPRAEKPVTTNVGDHDYTISTGPNYESEREAASDFADTLANLQGVFPRIADLVIKLKNLGPIGDEIAERLTPPEFRKQKDGKVDPQQLQQALAQQAQQLKQCEQALSEALRKVETDQAKQQAQVRIKELDLEFRRWQVEHDSDTQIPVAELGAKVDRLNLFLEERARIGLSADTAADRVHTSVEAERDRQHEAAMGTLEHQQGLEAAAQAGAQQQQAAAAAAAAPPVEGAGA
jgi:hypothetical protein